MHLVSSETLNLKIRLILIKINYSEGGAIKGASS